MADTTGNLGSEESSEGRHGTESRDSSTRRGDAGLAWLAVAGLVLLAALLFLDLLLSSEPFIPSHAQGDTARYFVWARLFGYGEILGGNVPLWNPHTFSGTPFVGVFQSSIFYPPNFIYLLFDLRIALIFEMAMGLMILGTCSFIWVYYKGLGAGASFLAAVLVIFGATSSLRVLAGQMTVLSTFAWWPLLLLAIDRLMIRSSLPWTLAGVGAVTLMILAGHPPTVLMAGIATGAYVLTPLWQSGRGALPRLLRLAPLVVAPLFLSAVQLWPGLHTASEGVRSQGMAFEFAVSHSFPPENLLTLIAPEALGNASQFYYSYFGRVFYWDSTLFIGLVGLLLAIHGALYSERPIRRVALWLCVGLVVVSMGGYTPVYRFFYEFVPGFSFVRAPSKFLYFASLFAALLAALGVEALAQTRRPFGRTLAIAVGLSLALAAATFWVWIMPIDAMGMGSPMALLESTRGAGDFVVQGLREDWHPLMLRSFAISTGLAALAALLLWRVRRDADRRAIWVTVLVAVAVIELFVFARMNRGTSRMLTELDLRPTAVAAYAEAGPRRVLETAAPSNIALGRRNFAIWGYDPVVLSRYAKFIAFTQGIDSEKIKNPTYLVPRQYDSLMAILRCGYEIDWTTKEIVEHETPLPLLFIVRGYRVEADQDAVLAAMREPDFDPLRTVILEEPPEPLPSPTPPERRDLYWLRGRSSDHYDIEADLAEPGILMLTDTFSTGWRATALKGSVQSNYTLLPGNHIIRAIPLQAGRHHLRVEYAPAAYYYGWLVSGSSGLVYVLAAGFALYSFASRRSRERPVKSA